VTSSWSKGRRSFPPKVRAEILRRDPVCVCTGWCGRHPGRCTAPSSIADHIVPHAEHGTDDLSNGQGLCSPCHDVKTRAEIARGKFRVSKAAARRDPEPHPGRLVPSTRPRR
jgi:5-methylcytosine-specific restriction protein A